MLTYVECVGSLQIVSDHDGDAPDGGVAASLEQLGHQEVEQVGQDVQHLKGNISPPAYVVYTPHSCSLLCSECRDTQLCGWCQLVWRNSGNCDLMGVCDTSSFIIFEGIMPLKVA